MNIDRARWLVLFAVPLLAACEEGMSGLSGEPASTFGEANRQTMMAQVVDPDPVYDTVNLETSGEHAAQAVDRYRQDKVKKPENIRSTQTSAGSGK